MDIAIFGASGHIGKNLIFYLKADAHLKYLALADLSKNYLVLFPLLKQKIVLLLLMMNF